MYSASASNDHPQDDDAEEGALPDVGKPLGKDTIKKRREREIKCLKLHTQVKKQLQRNYRK